MYPGSRTRGMRRNKTGGAWSPAFLFAAGEQGGWWDPSDFLTMFQDTAGTTPVTATGQSIALIRDKSGRGNHRTQATAGSRPTLQQDASGFYYLSYDGVDDFMVTGSVDFTGTNKASIVTGIYKTSDATTQVVLELSADASATPAFNIIIPTAALYRARFTGTLSATIDSGTATAPIAAVVTAAADIAAPSQLIRVNGAQVSGATTMGAGNFSNNPIYFGRRAGASLPFAGREYQTIIRGAASTADAISQAERFVGLRAGIAL